MSPFLEVRLVALRELERTLRSGKGAALAVLTLLGAFIASLACTSFEGGDRARSSAETTAAYVELKRQLLTHATGDPRFADYVAHMPTSLLVFLKVAVWLSPLLVALLGFDVVAGDLQHKTIRYWSVRTRRSSLLVGKLLGLWLLVAIVELAINVMAGSVALARGYVTPADLMTWGTRFFWVVLLIAGAWAAVATFVSSWFETPIVALLATCAAFFVLWLAGIQGFLTRVRETAGEAIARKMEWYEYLYPNAYDTMLLSPEGTRVLLGASLLLAFVVVGAASAAVVLARRDI